MFTFRQLSLTLRITAFFFNLKMKFKPPWSSSAPLAGAFLWGRASQMPEGQPETEVCNCAVIRRHIWRQKRNEDDVLVILHTRALG